MLTQLTATALYAVIAAGVLYQLATAARFAARAARKRLVRRPVAVVAAPPHRARRPRQREYRLALRLAKASLLAKS